MSWCCGTVADDLVLLKCYWWAVFMRRSGWADNEQLVMLNCSNKLVLLNCWLRCGVADYLVMRGYVAKCILLSCCVWCAAYDVDKMLVLTWCRYTGGYHLVLLNCWLSVYVAKCTLLVWNYYWWVNELVMTRLCWWTVVYKMMLWNYCWGSAGAKQLMVSWCCWTYVDDLVLVSCCLWAGVAELSLLRLCCLMIVDAVVLLNSCWWAGVAEPLLNS